MKNPTSRRRAAVAVALGSALALAGCAAAPDGVADDVSTEITDEPVTLSFVYFDNPPADDLMAAFTELHPNVTFDPQHIPFSDYVTSIKLSLNSSEAPDIAQYNVGAMRPLIKAGLIAGLGEWADAYGWSEKFPESNLRMLTADESAETFGVGNLYAVPIGTKFVGLYYNVDILDAAGVEVPQTLDELTDALDAVTGAGYRGLSVGGLEAGIVHLWAALQNTLQDPAEYESWVFGQEGSTIETDGAVEATELLAEWSAEGYIAAGASAVSDSDALAEFVAGKSAFIMTGNWAATGIVDGLGDAAGFVPVPAHDAGDARIAPGGSAAYSISAKSENANVAAAFLDFMATQEAAEVQLAAGLMPSGLEVEVTADGLRGEIIEAYRETIDGAGIRAFPDFATTGMLDVLKSGLQAVIAGQMPAEQFVASLQAEWADVHG